MSAHVGAIKETMLMNRTLLSLAALLALGTLAVSPVAAQITAAPNSMNFQGRLATPSGNPVPNGTYSIRFSLWNIASGGTAAANEKWNQTIATVQVRNGTFAVLLNTNTANLFNGNLWLEIKVGADAALTPRQQIVSVPYAFKAGSVADGSITSASIANGTITAADFSANIFNPLAWLLGGNSVTDPASHFLGTTDNQPLVFKVNNRRAMQYQYAENTASAGNEYRSINVLGGSELNSISAGVVGATIAGGGYDSFTLSDAPNRVTADFGTVGGGIGNIASGDSATVSGGTVNTASGSEATVGGGNNNRASGSRATVAGGAFNNASGSRATVAGGESNIASNFYATVGGGRNNIASNFYATVAGGSFNTASGESATVAGGAFNNASGFSATVGGGEGNTASFDLATVGGGDNNIASNFYATVAGGAFNNASGFIATVSGGYLNTASLDYATVGGGQGNTASGIHATVGGGYFNTASGQYAAVPGGYSNTAGGIGSFAAGVRASAGFSGSFVWADNHDATFASTAADQFCIRAFGGIVLETNQNAFLYTSSTVGEKNRYMMFLNSPQTSTASGVKAGGILCADNFGYANPGKNDMIVKGSLGVGYNFAPTNYAAAFNGSIFANGNYVSSDARYKKNIAPLGNALDSVLNLRGVSYEWDKAKFPTQNFGEGKQMGFIAQEIEKIFPQLVMTSPDGYKAVNYTGVIPVLVEAVKALKAQKDTEVNALKAENAELRAKLDALAEAVAKLQSNRK